MPNPSRSTRAAGYVFIIGLIVTAILAITIARALATTARPDITDDHVTRAETLHIAPGTTRHRIHVIIGPVHRYTARLRPGHRLIDYSTYRPRYMWEVHYTGTGPLRARRSSFVHCPTACLP